MLITPLKLLVRFLFRLLFRIEISGLEHYHEAGKRVLIVGNHVSLLDGALLYLFLPERPTFAINTRIAARWYFKPFLAFVDLFVMDPLQPISLKRLIDYLEQDHKAVIFPEGRITTTGAPMKIYEGPGMVAERSGATVLPIGLEGPQFSKLSYMKGKLRQVLFPRIRITVHPPERIILPEGLSSQQRRKLAAREMERIMAQVALHNSRMDQSLFGALLEAGERHGFATIIAEDIQRDPISYRQLIMRAFILGGLTARHTRPGEHVGVLLPNALATVITFFGLHSRGRIPAMLNFTVGLKGLVSACETARIRTVYTSRRFVEQAELTETVSQLESWVRVIYLEDLRSELSLSAKLGGLLMGRFPRLAVHLLGATRTDPEETAVVLFTSGSEGVPKGVALSHGNLLANRAQIRPLIGMVRTDLLFNALPMFHSFGLTAGTLLPLVEGCRLFLYPTPLHYRIIPELVYELEATIIFGTGTFLHGYARHAHPYDFHTLRYVVAGAEKLREETQSLWFEKFGIRIFEGYGATETSPVISVNTPLACRMGSVGRIVAGMDYYLEPVEGIEKGGRLVVSGPNVMKGYMFHGNEGQISPPWTERGQGWYDTGDIVDVDEDGFLYILGRAKRFAKIGGEMVSLTTVEDLASRTWPDAHHAALVQSDPARGEQIVLVTTREGAQRKELQMVAREIGLNELALPKKIITVRQIPVMGTGKTDYRQLTELLESGKLGSEHEEEKERDTAKPSTESGEQKPEAE
ncbi:MAG: acyl-[ACP]--phospholipid O-acyltransferase [Gammaproteobacteria bacterium]|nr:MAG: acyl-[ACP]--phospholipid O-acyltransferase [Gammaproteobacteria bacterium]